MPKNNVEIGFNASTDFPSIEVEQGQHLTRAPVLCAYFNLLYTEWAEEELALSSDEMVSTINGAKFTAGQDDSEREQVILDALYARKHGQAGEDVSPVMDIAAAQRVRADATNYGAKLTKEFSEHCRVFLDSIDNIRVACLYCLDDVAGRVWSNNDPARNWKGGVWTRDDIIKLPVPGTKAARGIVVDDSNRHLFDYYTYKTATKETINSSFYEDAAIATEPGATLWNELQELEEHIRTSATKNDADTKMRDTLKKRIRNCAKFLRDGVTVAKALIEFERLGGKVIYEVQRSEDGTPNKDCQYPLRIWQAGASGTASSFTLSNMRTMLKLDANKLNVVDKAIAKGGTYSAFKTAMPAKERGREKIIPVNNVRQFLNGMDSFTRFLNAGGDIPLQKALDDKETGLAAIEELGNFITRILPMWEGTYKAQYAELQAKKRSAAATKIAASHNAKVA